jgi:hypothetical protein
MQMGDEKIDLIQILPGAACQPLAAHLPGSAGTPSSRIGTPPFSSAPKTRRSSSLLFLPLSRALAPLAGRAEAWDCSATHQPAPPYSSPPSRFPSAEPPSHTPEVAEQHRSRAIDAAASFSPPWLCLTPSRFSCAGRRELHVRPRQEPTPLHRLPSGRRRPSLLCW